MEFVEMIKDPKRVLEFEEGVSSSDPAILKPTIKVFTNVYHNTLKSLEFGKLEDEESVIEAWLSVSGIVDKLLAMVRECENEGVLLHLLRFLEAAVTVHLAYQFFRFKTVFKRGRMVIKTGIETLKDLLSAPYIGGCSLNFGIRILISITCLSPLSTNVVTDILKKLIASLPPTLFDHNVRSVHKTLQKNLFRLLRQADNSELRGKLVDLMIKVGVSRRRILRLAPEALQLRKRSLQQLSDSYHIWGNFSQPPEKKHRTDTSVDSEKTSRSGPHTPDIPSDQCQQSHKEKELANGLNVETKERNRTDTTALDFIKSFLPLPKPVENKESRDEGQDEFCKLNKYFLDKSDSLNSVSRDTFSKPLECSLKSVTTNPSSIPSLSHNDPRHIHPSNLPEGEVDMMSNPHSNKDATLRNNDPAKCEETNSRAKPFTNQQEHHLETRVDLTNPEHSFRSDSQTVDQSKIAIKKETKSQQELRTASKSEGLKPCQRNWDQSPDKNRPPANHDASIKENIQQNSDEGRSKRSIETLIRPRIVSRRISNSRTNIDFQHRSFHPRVISNFPSRPSDRRTSDSFNRSNNSRNFIDITNHRNPPSFLRRPGCYPGRNVFPHRTYDTRVYRPTRTQGLLSYPVLPLNQQNNVGPSPLFAFGPQHYTNQSAASYTT